ncbi:hypothetical protein GP486_001579 [Trichoglossum hirsutum]|uniref:Heterokaryon incompatibility domain-containing protein n=1 Tax=Trichoglossum hirsutum TaxID=265104 RepID=A0A9P8LGF1_9PEZI|nr:hypothetical protein GP486_001579 [Trichoglossum hirsutum]
MAETPKAIQHRHPIRRDSRDSRAIHLLPGSGGEEICGELHNFCLDDASKEPYEALSYVWGDQSITRPIVVDGQEIQVTANLEAALRHIRKPDRTVVIWVDAICINQGDNAEKSHQVSMMHDIYRNCSQKELAYGQPNEVLQRSPEIFPKPRRIFFNLFMSDVMFVNGPREAHARGSPDSFHEVVRSFACQDCQDPRDKIYSLLALANTDRYANLKPDYSKNIAEVYAETFCSMLDETGGDFRCLLGHGFCDSSLGLPSWIRNFSVVVPRDVVVSDIRRLLTYRLYNTPNGIPGNLVRAVNKELHLSGFATDTVQAVGPGVRTVESDDLKAVFSQWLELAPSVPEPTAESTARKVLARLMRADIINDLQAVSQTGIHWRRALDADIPEEQVWQQFLDGDKWALGRAYRGGMEAAINGRAFFVTKSGRMGLCPLGVMAGDQIWVIFGSSVPFVLRPRNGSGEQSTHYLCGFVGDCYLQGIMDGEAIAERNIPAKGTSIIT